MFTVARKEVFSPDTFLWEVHDPDLAEAAQPGQFVMVRLGEESERIPLTVADFDRSRGTITLVVKVVGKTTEEMSTYPEGGQFLDLIGPLGTPSHIEKKDHVVLVGGGLGVAPIFPILRGFKEAGSRTTTVIGFRSGSDIFWQKRFEPFSDQFILMTEDGSAGKKGNVVDGLKEVILESGQAPAMEPKATSDQREREGEAPPALPVEGATQAPIDEILAIGPIPMMQAVAEFTRPYKIPTFASINSIMVDGIGMCGSCRVTVDGKVLFACVDGPDIDAHKIDFEELKIRQKRFQKEEKASLEKYHEECALKSRGLLS